MKFAVRPTSLSASSARLTLLLLAASACIASAKPPAGGGTAISYTARQPTPIKCGTSGGWSYDLANGYCCGGTLGSLVKDADGIYLLSNFHVLAADTAAGGNARVAQIGDAVIQPGLIDVSCDAASAQTVGLLNAWADPLQGANVDAAIASVVPGMVDTSGAILGIGTLSSSTRAPALNLKVKKSGRTTGLTRSTVSGLNYSVSVAYENECAGQTRGTATFTGQIIIANRGSKFLNSGDSGSLMVEDVNANPRAVGLLFAGGTSIAVANPIGDVLATLGVTMVGQPAAAPASATTSSDSPSPAQIARAASAQQRHARLIESAPNVNGYGISVNPAGIVFLNVLVERNPEAARAALPRQLDGIPVLVEEVGRIVAY
ncbi:MAG: S1 family peptidase [Lentisphaerae bacterium]|nr:S1 family peptidase [Lentisphaerota bacterium]